MKQRTFLTTLTLFLFFFNLGILIVSVAMFRDMINRAEDRSLNEHYFIASALIKDFQAVQGRGTDIDGSLNSLLQPYSFLSGDNTAGLAFYKNNQLIYSSKDIAVLKDNSLEPPVDGSRLATIQKVDDRTYVIVSGKLPAPYASYTLVYLYDTTEAINSWRHLKNILFFTGFVLSVLFAFGLLLVLNRIFRPLKQISRTSKDIAEGAYQTRLPVSGHDELTEMSQSFNHMAAEIQHQMTELKDAAAKKQQFVDNFAHELRTPLTAIYGYAEYLQKAVLSEDDRLSALNYIMSESHRLQMVAYQLLELANLQNNQITCEELKVSNLFEAVLQTLTGKLANNEIQIEFRCEIESIRGDSYLMESLLINLIDNAAKACGKGGNIVVSAIMEAERKIICVRDNGKGMTPEILSQITEPFYRGEKSRNRNDGGAGLGLALCKQIASSHKAQLSFLSRPGEGTTVKITFTT
ncbi:HAMP domain-containing sensor histidine kinase [Anaerocolumna sp. AGMB13025]|uniref:sensor histidine kinase n=1 Tax=Anaerocolumna sp. AGMB13025 TaxID=3039116 RepID=UPI00241DA795|nr:HAMP domain-containing sensor histidine kinase [Anaerocolumna sp. AGMB13025]WFR58055.1 HAMP domain-containing sensor histidine kinase [Anaerocolumna sp. AGMB13025]